MATRVVIHRRFHDRGHRIARALEAGFRHLAVTPVITSSEDPDPRATVACVWGGNQRRLWDGYRRRGVPMLVAENGYLGDRDRWTSLGWSGLNGEADFCLDQDHVTGARLAEHHPDIYRPWKPPQSGAAVALMGQVANDASLGGLDLIHWLTLQARPLLDQGRQVYYRPHPSRPNGRVPSGSLVVTSPLVHVLSLVGYVVTWSSTVGVETLMEGVPTMAGGTASMAYGVAASSLQQLLAAEEPVDREGWAHRMAWTQWTDDEMASGEALRHLRARGGY